MVSADKLPPFDVEAEEAVIASILVDDDAISRVESIVQPEHFYRDQNRWAYEACIELWARNETINQLTLGHELSRRGKLDDVGGQPYLSRIVGDLPTPIGVEHYAGIVRRDFMYRSMITVGSQIVQVAYQGGPDLEGAITRAENLVMELRTSHRTGDLVPLRQYLDEFWESQGIDSPFAGTIGAVRSGFMDLDQLLGGFHRSDLIVCAARPSVGKSSLLLNFARNAAVGHNARVAIFTIEMKGEQIVERLLASESGVDGTRIRLHQHNDTDEQRLMQATGILHGLEIYIDDSSIVTVAQMQAKLKRLVQQIGGIDLVLIDYLQLMQGDRRHRDNRVQEVSEISRGLKMIARDLDVPVIAAAQLSRAPEMRQPHIPMLSDLRESGSIEQDADVVMFLYREDIYVSREDWEMRNFDQPYPEGITKLIVAKHRNGPTGVVHLRFRNHLSRFEDLMVLEEEIRVTFAGFPARAQATPIPHVFFSDLLPRLAHDAIALGVTLYAFQALHRKKGFPRYIAADDLIAEPALLSYLMNADTDESAVAHGLQKAAELGVLLPLAVECEGAAMELYFLNTPADRRGLEAVRSGAVDIGAAVPRARVPAPLARSNVYALYESHVGTLTPLVADELAEAERLYPQEWFERAFREAAAQNVRSWRYVSRILERWSIEGPDHEKADGDPAGDERYFAGKYGRILKQRLQP